MTLDDLRTLSSLIKKFQKEYYPDSNMLFPKEGEQFLKAMKRGELINIRFLVVDEINKIIDDKYKGEIDGKKV